MKISNIHEKWGSVIELDNPLDFFKFHKNYWRDLLYKRKLLNMGIIINVGLHQIIK